MKLVVQIEVSHDLAGLDVLMRALPLALQSVATATNAGIAETGPDGIMIMPPGSTSVLATVRFKLRAEETTQRVTDLTPASPGEHAP